MVHTSPFSRVRWGPWRPGSGEQREGQTAARAMLLAAWGGALGMVPVKIQSSPVSSSQFKSVQVRTGQNKA